MGKEDDLALWRRVAKTVKPLEGRKVRFRRKAELPSSEPAADKAAPRIKAPARQQAPPKPLPAQAAASSPMLAHGQTAGVDGRTASRLRRGKLPIEAALDLHGYRQTDAHHALISFVTSQQAAGRRCVIVVTGKGSRGENGGVLRHKVPLWLNNSPLRDKVLAFDFARPEHGGSGALYVLLRRKRDF